MLALVLAAFVLAVVSGTVEDENHQPIPGVHVTVHFGNDVEHTATNELGHFQFDAAEPGEYRLDFDKAGFFRLTSHPVNVATAPAEIGIVLNHEYEMHSAVDVIASPAALDPHETQHTDQLVAHEIRDEPVASSHTLQNALTALPAIVQDSNGILHIAGARNEDTLYVLDRFQINNPATGLFDARLNVDAVRSVDVSTGRYGAQFANAGSGVLAIESNTGDDHWRLGTTNFLPSASFQRGVHLGNWFPRMTVSGPLSAGRAWFSDGLSVQHSFTLVSEQPPGSDTSEDWSADNLLKGQYNFTPSHSLLGNFLYNSSDGKRAGLGPFAPASTTTDLRERRVFVSLKDQVVLHDGLLEFGVAADTDHFNRLPQGSETYVLTPSGPQGNFFERLRQNSRRWQARSDVTLAGRGWHGIHDLDFGVNADGSHLDQDARRQPVEVLGATGLLRRSTFWGGSDISVSENQTGAYAQDAWRILRVLVLQPGIRLDWNSYFGRALAQPRLAVNWMPHADLMKFSLGWGRYYQPSYLAFLSQTCDQQRLDTFTSGAPESIRTLFSTPGFLSPPYFDTRTAESDIAWTDHTTMTVSFIDRAQHQGLAYQNVSVDPAVRDLRINNDRRDQYKALEISLRHSMSDGSELILDYVRSHANSNKIFDFSIDDLLLTEQAGGPLSWDAPHRIISRGARRIHFWNLFLSYFAEYHTGYPFTVFNSRYELAGTPNGFRYPAYFDVNVGAERRFRFFRYEWAVRLSAINMTNHRNYNSVINTVDAPNFLTYGGGQRRAFTARIRLVGRK